MDTNGGEVVDMPDLIQVISFQGVKTMNAARTLLLGLQCCLVFTLTSRDSNAGDATAAVNETIVYSTLQPANWDIYLFEEPAQSPRRLTKHPAQDHNAVFSPDGRWVVFTSERDGNVDLYAIDAAGERGPQRLTRRSSMEDAAAFSPDGRSLAFVSTRSGNADIFVAPFASQGQLNEDAAVNVSRHVAGDFNPCFSPDGEWIAFSSSRDATVSAYESLEYLQNHHAADIYVMKRDGTEVRRLTQHPHWDGSPAWSADGKALFFYSNRDGDNHLRLYRLGLDGSEPEAVDVKAEAVLSPTVSTTGRIAFTARRKGVWTILSSALDGSDVQVESDTKRHYWAPSFDHQSSRLVCHGEGPTDPSSRFESDTPGPFHVNRHSAALPDRAVDLRAIRGYIPALNRTTAEVASSENFGRIVTCKLDGSHLREVFRRAPKVTYRGDLSAWAPTWSADGKWIACAVGTPFAGAGGDVDIWKFRADGSGAVNLTPSSKANDAFPQFSPDGQRIVFRSNRDGNFEIYLMDADGTQVRRLTKHDATDTMPALSSRGDRVAFASMRSGDFEIYLLELDGAGNAKGTPKRITHSPGPDMHPAFSPDDRWLLFTSARGGLNDETPLVGTKPLFTPQPYGEIFALRLGDGKVVRLTHNKWEDGPAAWARLEGGF